MGQYPPMHSILLHVLPTHTDIFFLVLGEEIIAGDDLYGGSDRLLSQITPKSGIVVKLVLF